MSIRADFFFVCFVFFFFCHGWSSSICQTHHTSAQRCLFFYGLESSWLPAALRLRPAKHHSGGKGRGRALPSLPIRSTTCLTFCPLDKGSSAAAAAPAMLPRTGIRKEKNKWGFSLRCALCLLLCFAQGWYHRMVDFSSSNHYIAAMLPWPSFKWRSLPVTCGIYAYTKTIEGYTLQ